MDLSVGDIDFWWADWVYLDTAGGTGQNLVSKWNSDGSQREYIVAYSILTASRFEFIARKGDDSAQTTVAANTFGAPTTGTWYFIIIYHDATNDLVGISVNGGAFDTAAHTGGVNNGTANFALGSYGDGGSYLNGRLDSIAFGKNPVGGIAGLATAIRDSLYNSGAGKRWADLTSNEKTNWGLVSFWDFASPSAGLVADSQGSNTLTNNNGVTFAAGIVSGQATATGDPVTTWEDQSGNGNDATQATASKRPTLQLAVQNGLPVVRFDGVDDLISMTRVIDGPSSFTVVAVFTFRSTAGNFALLLWNGSNSTESGFGMVRKPSSTVYYPGWGSSNAEVSLGAVADGTFAIWTSTYNGSQHEAFLNGASQGTAPKNNSNFSSGGTTLGNLDAGSSYYAEVDISEILIFPTALSDADRQAVETYLNARWNVY